MLTTEQLQTTIDIWNGLSDISLYDTLDLPPQIQLFLIRSSPNAFARINNPVEEATRLHNMLWIL